ncbi:MULTISPECIES: hypothetical protein [Moorena]|uniref:hypothetical protein n=1 Tax=Moorena TaxID=1155738 RepID=UPI00031A1A71|nr:MULTISPECIES: hypothetical protein [Moorena]NEQ15128.1 hypothetical protein [Moorena sp. SIO3E2]NEP31211.1 hypothetical protein [Moorena sp. SIO3B2]NEQ06815.1 hypothetical protein [Moorena sp. SIO4E2]NER88649.1 hypothetical protein [Moorena sp. SIO3A2]NES41270.1 hypothetical protein [Moorena sp. SIO2C4]
MFLWNRFRQSRRCANAIDRRSRYAMKRSFRACAIDRRSRYANALQGISREAGAPNRQ